MRKLAVWTRKKALESAFPHACAAYASAISTVVMIIFALIAFAQFKVNNGGET